MVTIVVVVVWAETALTMKEIKGVISWELLSWLVQNLDYPADGLPLSTRVGRGCLAASSPRRINGTFF